MLDFYLLYYLSKLVMKFKTDRAMKKRKFYKSKFNNQSRGYFSF